MTIEMAAPARSTEQRMEALRAANYVRTYRAELKRRVTADWQVASQALTENNPDVQSMCVHSLLLAIRGFGRTRVNRLMTSAGCSLRKTIGGLSERQRAALVLELARIKGRR